MNIEIANKLLELRKAKGLSQEQLAQKLGISRQAVSKWERGEASPDTDNLIELARLYDISLDELLLHEPTNKKEEASEEDYAHVGWDGIHVKEKDGDEVHISWDGIHVHDKEDNQVNIDKNGVYVNGKKYNKEDFKHDHHNADFPIGMLFILIYILYGLFTNIWHPTWIILLIWPTVTGFRDCIKKKRISAFPYPIFCTAIFLAIGFLNGVWHPTWVIFLTIPCFYGIANYLDHKKL